MRRSVLRKHRRPSPFKRCLPLTIVCAVVLISVILLLCLLPRASEKVSLSELTLLPCSAESEFTPFGAGAAYLDGENLYYADETGEIRWGFSGAAEGMTLTAAGDHLAAVYGKKLQVLSLEGNLLFSKEFDSTIKAVCVSNTLTAVRLSGSDSILLLSPSGELLDTLASSSACTNIRFGLYNHSGAGTTLWVISVENSGYTPVYSLSTYHYSGSKSQTVTFETDTQMFSEALLCESELLMVGSQNAVRGDWKGSTLSTHITAGFTYTCGGMVKDTLTALYLNANGRARVIGKEDKTLAFDTPIRWAAVTVRDLWFFGEHTFYRVRSGSTSAFHLPVTASNVLAGDGFVLLISGSNVYRYKL